ncbi:nuclear transport factor 2 family protein [Pedobacter jamesrossensis]|uniref:Nuclear transport factor 2 family protein n=1 Tax=Pedobacter jamesrossensis TaxID=1908238 RepID=A0ABV8NLZ9_9SPHI
MINEVKTAKELLLDYMEHIGNPEIALELFSPEAVIELPFLNSLGMPWQWKGKNAIDVFLKGIPNLFPEFKFANVNIYIDTPNQVFAEYDVIGSVTATKLPYYQTYAGRLVADNGKILLLRESLDMIRVIKSMFPEVASQLPINDQ